MNSTTGPGGARAGATRSASPRAAPAQQPADLSVLGGRGQTLARQKLLLPWHSDSAYPVNPTPTVGLIGYSRRSSAYTVFGHERNER